jgi:hypothetical protein
MLSLYIHIINSAPLIIVIVYIPRVTMRKVTTVDHHARRHALCKNFTMLTLMIGIPTEYIFMSFEVEYA